MVEFRHIHGSMILINQPDFGGANCGESLPSLIIVTGRELLFPTIISGLEKYVSKSWGSTILLSL